MDEQLVTMLLPALSARTAPSFNVFDVMHHGTHEKQLSNVFAWLLDSSGTHGLGDSFQKIFIAAVNRSRLPGTEIATGSFSVRQEVNVSLPDEPMDIADLVLEDDDTMLVIENYYTSDGHGHSYQRYLDYGARTGKSSVVVMLCASVDIGLLSDGWQSAAIVSYEDLIVPLVDRVERDSQYQRTHADQVAFFRHLHHRFVKDRTMTDRDMIQFVTAMCSTGQAKHYRTQSAEAAAVNFADSLREEAHDQFAESRAWLLRVKAAVKNYAVHQLVPQLTEVLGPDYVHGVSANYSGIYQWTVNFRIAGEEGDDEAPFQLKFGPSAWFANEADKTWQKVVHDPDYARLFITHRAKEVRQSDITLQEVLDGLADNDFRLRDEAVSLLKGSA